MEKNIQYPRKTFQPSGGTQQQKQANTADTRRLLHTPLATIALSLASLLFTLGASRRAFTFYEVELFSGCFAHVIP